MRVMVIQSIVMLKFFGAQCQRGRRRKAVVIGPAGERVYIDHVAAIKDVISLEKTGMCKWVYHVLNGHIAPLEGIEPSDLTIDQLAQRIRTGSIEEVVMATNPNVEGDGTALYISSLLRPLKVKVTRLARGLPTGSTIEYSAGSILAEAILARSKF